MRPSPTPSTLVQTLVLGLLLTLTGCVYRMPIQQGNFLDPAQVAQLETGMTRSQVMFLLGTPMIPSGFDTDRWDYFYSLKNRRLRAPVTKRITVYFVNDKVARVEQGPDSGNPKPAALPTPAPPPSTG